MWALFKVLSGLLVLTYMYLAMAAMASAPSTTVLLYWMVNSVEYGCMATTALWC